MKKLLIFCIMFIIVGCNYKKIDNNLDVINLDFDYNVTSDSITFNVK